MGGKSRYEVMHSALSSAYMVLAKAHMDNSPIPTSELVRVLTELEQALAVKPCNCDEGTAEEQDARFLQYCCKHVRCEKCEIYNRGGGLRLCRLRWAQMPYSIEEGV